MSGDFSIDTIIALALRAGAAIMAVYRTGSKPRLKPDRTPLTEADIAAEAIILAGLEKHFPDIPVISEEAAGQGRIPATGERFFLVDPLDGTREFISGNGEFTVNIALIEHGRPVAGVVYGPALQRLCVGRAGLGASQARLAPHDDPAGAGFTPLRARPVPATDPVAVASRSHRDRDTDAWLAEHGIAHTVSAGSSLKFCLVAAGEADLYPRFGPTMEWDTAAGQAVLEAAGGAVETLDGAPLAYGKRRAGFANPAFIARGARRPGER